MLYGATATTVRQLSFIIERVRRPSREEPLEFKSLFAQQKAGDFYICRAIYPRTNLRQSFVMRDFSVA